MEPIPSEVGHALVDPEAYADDRRLQEALAWLRKHRPVGLIEVDGYDPFWAITKHSDLLEVSRNNRLFHNGDRGTTLIDKIGDENIRQMTGGSPHVIRSLVQMDPPDHPKYRALTQDWFKPANVRQLEARIREIATASIDRMAAMGGACDFVSDVALRFPLHVIMEILGVPESDEPRMLKLTQELFGVQDTDLNQRRAESDLREQARLLQEVAADFNAYFSAISENRRRHPRDDLATTIATSTIDGAPINDFEALCYYMLVATAGHDTTSSSTAGAIWAFCEDPAEFRKVKSDPGFIPTLVDEAIRWITPVKHFMRSAVEDTVIRGQPIAAGDWMMLCYLSGNRDEEVFEEPDRFKADRSPNRHLAFGYGPHVCLGQHLAKLEIRIFFEELMPRLDSIEFDGEPQRSKGTFVSGPKLLPIRYRMN